MSDIGSRLRWTAFLLLSSGTVLAQSLGPISGGPVGGGPLTGTVTSDPGIKPLPTAPAETDFWPSESSLAGKGAEVKVNTSFDWSKVSASSGGPIGANTPGWLKRPFWLPYPWQDLPFVDIQPMRGQSKPGGKNYQIYKDWEASALSALQPMDRAAMNNKKWYSGSPALGSAIRSPIAQCQFSVNPDGSVQGSIWVPKRREQPDLNIQGSKERIYLQQIAIKGNVIGDVIRFDAEGLPGVLEYVGKNYGLKGEFLGKEFDSLISPLFDDAWKAAEAAVKKPAAVPTQVTTSFGATSTKWE